VSAAALDGAAEGLLTAPLPATSLPVRLSADFVDLPPAGPQVVVRARVDGAALRFTEAGGRRQATVDLVGGVRDAGGRAVGAPFGRRAELDLAPAEHRKVLETGLQYETTVALPPGKYEVRFVARQEAAERAGRAVQPVEVPDLAARTLALSGIFLSSGAPGAAGDALRDVQVERRFRRGQSLFFQIYAYNVTRDAAGASDAVLQAQLLSGGAVIAASKPEPVRLQVKDGAPLPETNSVTLDGLAPGPYELRLLVVDRKARVQTSRRIDFTLE
jgi:hypothetical protein